MSKTDRLLEFDTEILSIEFEFIDFLMNGMIKYSGRTPIFAKIISYFFTRQSLTQKEIQKLTGLSAGVISQTLRMFENMKIIKTNFRKEKYEKEYTMDGISFGKSTYVLNIERKSTEFISKLQKMKKTLEENFEKMKTFDGFDKIYCLIPQLLFILESLPERLNGFQKGLENEISRTQMDQSLLKNK